MNHKTTGWVGLYPFQREAVDKMHKGCILKGGVGSGKSITSLAYYYKMMRGDIDSERFQPLHVNPCDLIIITTAKKRDSKEWEGELSRFHLSVWDAESNYDHRIYIDSWNNISKYEEIKNAFFIFDEDRLTGDGAWTKSFQRIAKNNHWVILSATPGDTWSDYTQVFIANGYFRNKTDFQKQHVIFDPYVTKFPKIKGYFGEQKLRKLREMIEVDMDFMRPTIRHDIPVECPYDRVVYFDVIKNRWNHFKNKPIENVAELYAVIRRISNNPEYRIEEIKRRFSEGPDKLIIFYNFDYELEYLRQLDGYLGFKVAEWNGHKHEPIPDCNKWIYLVNYKAGAEGWNCIKTDTIAFFSQTYSYKELEQAKGRIDRVNTPFTDLYYYHFRSNSPIDRAITLAQKTKKDFNQGKYTRKMGWA